jgi:hypothetical protein
LDGGVVAEEKDLHFFERDPRHYSVDHRRKLGGYRPPFPPVESSRGSASELDIPGLLVSNLTRGHFPTPPAYYLHSSRRAPQGKTLTWVRVPKPWRPGEPAIPCLHCAIVQVSWRRHRDEKVAWTRATLRAASNSPSYRLWSLGESIRDKNPSVIGGSDRKGLRGERSSPPESRSGDWARILSREGHTGGKGRLPPITTI